MVLNLQYMGYLEEDFVSGDEVDITDYIPIDESYLNDPSDFFEKEDVKLETKEEPKTIWVSVNELKGRNLMLFRFINPEISTNDLKHKIVEEARRRAENIGQKKHLGFDDFKLLFDGAIMVSDDSIGDYLDNKMQKKLDVEVYLTLRGGFKYLLCSPRNLGKVSTWTNENYFSDGWRWPTN